MSIKRRILGPIVLLILIGVVAASCLSLAAIQTQNAIQMSDTRTLRALQAAERAQRIREEIETQLFRFLEFNIVSHPAQISRRHAKFVEAFQDAWSILEASEGSDRQKAMTQRVARQFDVWNTDASIALGLIADTHVPSHSRLERLAQRLELDLVALEQEVRASALQANRSERQKYARQVVIVFAAMIVVFLIAGSMFLGFGSHLVFSLTRLAAAMESIRNGNYDTTVRDLTRKDEVGQIARGVAAFSHTLQDLSAAKSRIEHLALHDQLTDLPNRRALQEYLQRHLAEAQTTPNLLRSCISIWTGSSRSTI